MRARAVAAFAGLVVAAGVALHARGHVLAREGTSPGGVGAGPVDVAVHEVAPGRPGTWLAVFVTGDDGWSAADRELARALAKRNVAVAAIDARVYLRTRRTPDAAARDVDRLIRHYGVAWGRPRVALLGYSRGADLVPFIANRLPPDSRARVGLVALVGPGERASFEVHWTDVVLSRSRATDLPVLPELERLRGVRMLCVRGEDERDSICRRLDPALATPVTHDGSRRLAEGGSADLANRIVAALPQ
jgi:type IV secretory pathway VirJ component